jgi:uncharacterized protein YdhG (YjbR/CyaY superfamily)
MTAERPGPKTIDEYIAALPPHVQAIMEQIRATIREAAPGVDEVISYKMPGFRLNGDFLIYIGAYKKHVGLYPAPVGVNELEERLSTYTSGKATLRFPLDRPIPYDLIRDIVALRVNEQVARAEAQRRK